MGDWIRGALDLRIWGAPSLPPNLRENGCFIGVWGNFEAKMGRPKFADPTPHEPNPRIKTTPSDNPNVLESN